jgi:hypothetical protein
MIFAISPLPFSDLHRIPASLNDAAAKSGADSSVPTIAVLFL